MIFPSSFRFRPLPGMCLVVAVLGAAPPGFAHPAGAAQRNRLLPVAPAVTYAAPQASDLSLGLLYKQASDAFWAVEPTFNNYTNPITKLAPLMRGDPAIAGYLRAEAAARRFLRAQKAGGSTSESADDPTGYVLYFAAMSDARTSNLSSGDRGMALYFVNRLLKEYPDFSWQRMADYPDTKRLCRPDLMHLRL